MSEAKDESRSTAKLGERISDKAAKAMADAGIQVFDLIDRDRIFKACNMIGSNDFGSELLGVETAKATTRMQYVITTLVRDGYIRKSVRSDSRMYRVLRLTTPNVEVRGK
jgi:hypothetical protein